MSTDLTSALAPRRDDGGIDQRFTSIVNNALAKQPQATINKLIEAKEANQEHQRKYYPYIRDVVLGILNEAADAKLDGYYRKHIREIVQTFGFTPDSATRIVGALTLVHESILNRSSDAAWLKELPVRTAYALSKCSDEGRTKAWVGSNWGEQPLTVSEAETLARRYPKPALFGRGSGSGRRPQTPFVVSDKNKTDVDALSAASPVTAQSYTAPTPKVEESPSSEVIEAVAVSVINTDVVEEAKSVGVLAIDDAFYMAFEQAVFHLDELPAEQREIVNRIGNLAASYNLGRAFRR